MSSAKWSTALVVVALLGVALGYGWATRAKREADATPAQNDTVATTAVNGARRILYWRDPMKPDVRFDKPGKSPFMDMELVPVYAEGGAGTDMNAGDVSVSTRVQQNLGIRLGRVEKATLAARATAVGAVSYDEHAIAVVQARVAGYVSRLPVRAALDRVRRGQVLVEVSSPEWLDAEGEYLALLRTESPASAALRQAARQRLLVLGIPEQAIHELEQSRSVPAATALLAPIDGVVTELGLREGASFEPGAVLFRINGVSTVWVNAQLPEALARIAAPGAMVESRDAALPGVVFRGRVQSILPQIDPATRTVSVRIAIDNAAGRLSPGMFMQTTFIGAAGAPQLWLPSEAVIVTGQRSVVIRKGDGNSFEVVNVTLGEEAEGKTAILSGLAEGQAVVLSGQFLIDSEASLKSTVNRLATAPGTNPESVP
jgi:Cu(I)/Ag(I) efflux system membrane fusion protein